MSKKINQLGLTFNEHSFYYDLIDKLVLSVLLACTHIKDGMRREASPAIDDDNSWFIDSQTSDKTWLLVDSTMKEIIFHVGAKNWLAYLDNYGTGSLMARANSNPFLQEYINNSPFFNKERLKNGMAVVGRPEGTYLSPDYRDGKGVIERYSKGKMEGLNLEEKINPRTKKPYFIPDSPKYWLEQGIEQDGIAYLKQEVENALAEFKYSSYLFGGD